MGNSALDVPALALTILVAVVIAATLLVAHRHSNRRGWVAAGLLTMALVAIGVADLLRSSPRETHFTTVIVGVALPVIGALGIVRGTRGVREWLRWMLVFLTAFVLLIGGLQLGATVASRLIPF